MHKDLFMDCRDLSHAFSTQEINNNLYRKSTADEELNNKFLKQYEAHTRDYLENLERYGGTPILTPQCYELNYRHGDDYLIPHMVANDEGDYCQKRGYRTSQQSRPR